MKTMMLTMTDAMDMVAADPAKHAYHAATDAAASMNVSWGAISAETDTPKMSAATMPRVEEKPFIFSTYSFGDLLRRRSWQRYESVAL